ncbi:MAG: UDP-N-acetylmuramate--L-alanine ligase [Candidatus Pacebacteria bacterium]|nr:UDP-N-acetylmuramate--L-alanine ligase [Candidatus Paceibacterota bacterium]
MNNINLEKTQKIFFFGIGGSGVSAIARLFHMQGKDVSGCDRSDSETVHELQNEGISVTIGQSFASVPADTDCIIYSQALAVAEPELLQKLQDAFPSVISYPETLGILFDTKKILAVSGTHGKTTTTAMLGKILVDAGLDPTIIVGSVMADIGSNVRVGNSEHVVIEADEYRRAFLQYHPWCLGINNIDADHLDYYKDLADIQNAFQSLVSQTQQDGCVITNPTDAHIVPVIQNTSLPIIDYTLHTDIQTSLPGEHNRSNARLAYAMARHVGVSDTQVRTSLLQFGGTQRRFQLHGTTEKGALLYDDYAHNPQKVSALIDAFREQYPDKKIVLVFQPHLISRTESLFDAFVDSLARADEILLAPIYVARESDNQNVSSEPLANTLRERGVSATAFDSLESLVPEIKNNFNHDYVVCLTGAGDIISLVPDLVYASK